MTADGGKAHSCNYHDGVGHGVRNSIERWKHFDDQVRANAKPRGPGPETAGYKRWCRRHRPFHWLRCYDPEAGRCHYRLGHKGDHQRDGLEHLESEPAKARRQVARSLGTVVGRQHGGQSHIAEPSFPAEAMLIPRRPKRGSLTVGVAALRSQWIGGVRTGGTGSDMFQVCSSSRYAGVKAERKLSLFSVPKDESRRKILERNLHRSDKALEENCAVCELHFEDRYILREYVHIIDGKEVRIARGVPALTPDAVPTVLPNVPKYLSTKLPPKRAPRKREAPTVPGPQNSKKACTSTPVDEDFESQGDVHDVSTASLKLENLRERPIQFARSAPYSVNECRLSKSAPFVPLRSF
ncbi:hypothetical protein HPB52_004021 [Rhipicephalus sanguineus]|uniref:THAP-type domain-containing protein n=1 Tax=Rhipicephalus sanguineus TaxID=34632 RepID=A0A9D4PHW9_RHISA|nr:hypothetical protein HPB52_004021 [Rhipicephalus sanguineus]